MNANQTSVKRSRAKREVAFAAQDWIDEFGSLRNRVERSASVNSAISLREASKPSLTARPLPRLDLNLLLSVDVFESANSLERCLRSHQSTVVHQDHSDCGAYSFR